MIPVVLFGQVNVKNVPWNALGNGSADDTIAINMALDAVAKAGGGTVDCPAGNYMVSSPIKWAANDVYLRGDGGCNIIPLANFKGEAVIMVGKPSATSSPTKYGGIDNIHIDMGNNYNPKLIGAELIQTWFSVINKLRITSANGLPLPIQTAFQMNAGELPNGGWLTNWSSNNHITDLQISGSFLNTVRHVSGCAETAVNCYGQVNGTIYTGGFGFGTTQNKVGSYGFRIDSGDSTKVYGFALEDYDIGVYTGTMNNGPYDFRIEDCTTQYKFGEGITVSNIVSNQGQVTVPVQ